MLFFLKDESGRLIIWIPVCFAAGAMAYLSLPFEPTPSIMLAVAPMILLTRRAWRRGNIAWLFLAGLTVVSGGFGWMQAYTRLDSTIMLQEELRFTDVSGRIVEISDVPKGYRVTLDDVQIDGLSADETPSRVRLKLRGNSGEGLLSGQSIALRAGLLPPSGPVMSGGFDFARYFFFKRIGAVGYAIPPITMLDVEHQSGFWIWLTTLREALSERVRAQMSAPEGAVAAALMMGDRAAIPDSVAQIMRDTNLSHILAISGMHMALATGLVFFSLRWLLASIPATRYLRHPKKMAAFLSLLAGLVYLLLAGLPISASRAFIMVALVFGAILLDRQVMPMRSLAIAALLLLLLNPSYAAQPGFQLSFAATAALIAWYESVRKSAAHYFEPEQRRQRWVLYFAGVMMTSLVAEIATAPLVLYHFNNLSFYGLLANLIVMPLVSFWIMPFIVISYVLLPFGLEYLALDIVEWGITIMLAAAKWVANIPGAQSFVISPPGWGMAICAIGMAWMIIWRKRWRYLGVLPVAVGCLSVFTVQSPDLFVSADGKQIAARVDGEFFMLKGRGNSFTPQQWANGSGDAEFARIDKHNPAWQCDMLGCIYKYAGRVIAFPSSFEAQAEDCKRADMLITPFYLYDSECEAQVIDKRKRKQQGHLWFWLGNEIRTQSTQDVQGNRPWSGREKKLKRVNSFH